MEYWSRSDRKDMSSICMPQYKCCVFKKKCCQYSLKYLQITNICSKIYNLLLHLDATQFSLYLWNMACRLLLQVKMQVNKQIRNKYFWYTTLNICRSQSVFMFCFKECLRLFSKEEKLTDNNRFYCSHCKTRRDSLKKIEIWKLPPVLLVHLKR